MTFRTCFDSVMLVAFQAGLLFESPWSKNIIVKEKTHSDLKLFKCEEHALLSKTGSNNLPGYVRGWSVNDVKAHVTAFTIFIDTSEGKGFFFNLFPDA